LVTSETGAAVRDMIRVARRRNPNVGILLAPCAVQGAAAVPEIVRSIRRLNENGECDVLLVGRGGGSIEDLWAFNEEAVARAIAASKIPVISCVGHEIDFTIADFVADLRAPTPSAAAELAVPVLEELQGSLSVVGSRLARALESGQRIRRAELNRISSSAVLTMPQRTILQPCQDRLIALEQRANSVMLRRQEISANRFRMAAGMLRSLNPNSVIDRGYAIVSQGRRMVTRAGDIASNSEFMLRMADGSVRARAVQIEVNEGDGQKETDV